MSNYFRNNGQSPNSAVPVPAPPVKPDERIDPSQFVNPNPQLRETRTAELDARGIPTDGKFPVVVRQDGEFLSRLPSKELQNFARFVTIPGATAMPAAFNTYIMPLYNVPRGQGLILLKVNQYWFDDNVDPLDADVLEPLQDFQNANGRVSMVLNQGGTPVFNVTSSVYDPVGVTRTPDGYTILNQNVLNLGQHPSAAFIGEASNISCVIRTASLLPAHIPAVVGVNIEGYLLPYTAMLNFFRSLRLGF